MSPNPAALRLEQLTEAVAARVVNEVLAAIDVNALLGRVDVEGIIDRVDVENIIERVDVEGIVKRIDVNAIVGEIDIDSLVENTELGSLIVKSTAGILTEILDGVRAQGVTLDDFCAKWTNRILRRNPASLPVAPDYIASGSQVNPTSPPTDGLTTRPPVAKGPAPVSRERLEPVPDTPHSAQLTVERQGQYAGVVSRLAAIAMDGLASWAIYVAAGALVTFAIELVTSRTFDLTKHPVVAVTALVIWEFAYFSYQWAISGRTIGMAILGIRVEGPDAGPIGGRAACIRTLVLPLSIAALFLGCLGILTNRARQGWHDRLAGTVVVYAWDAKAARLRRLADRNLPQSG